MTTISRKKELIPKNEQVLPSKKLQISPGEAETMAAQPSNTNVITREIYFQWQVARDIYVTMAVVFKRESTDKIVSEDMSPVLVFLQYVLRL